MPPETNPSEMNSLTPVKGANRGLRERLDVKDEFVLAMLPTATVLLVLLAVEIITEQRLLFASLASSAFLIYLDPEHGTNSVRTLMIAQPLAAVLGWITFSLLGSGYTSSGTAMVLTIVLMIALDAVHPPAVGTAMSFALRAGEASNLLLFALAVGVTAILVILQRAALWILSHRRKRRDLQSAAPG